MDLSIGTLANRVGCKVPTIRYYEQIKLLSEPLRTNGNQRRYSESHLKQLRFICHARELGFTIDAIRQLISLSEEDESKNQISLHSADEMASKHLYEIETKIEQLSALRDEMRRILAACDRGEAHNCQVLNVLDNHSLCLYEHS